MNKDDQTAPRVPITGAAGIAIAAALAKVATHCGEISVTIHKGRVASGGYAYTITHTQPPGRPAT